MATYYGTATSGTAAVTGYTATNANGFVGLSYTYGWSAVYGYCEGGAGVHGVGYGTYNYGVYGDGDGYSGANYGYGVYGIHRGSSGVGVYGEGPGTYGTGVHGDAEDGVGVVGSGGTAGVHALGDVDGLYAVGGTRAAYLNGDVVVAGNLSKGGGGFLIDHPEDPADRILEHSFVESPDRKNIYDGVAAADTNGEAIVTLPSYFEVLNSSIRYQLTAIGAPAPGLHVKKEVANGSFTIGGANPGQKVSWLVTGVRQDRWALDNPLVVERNKPVDERGYYLHPKAHGQPSEKGVDTKRYPPVARPGAPQPPKAPPRQAPPSTTP